MVTGSGERRGRGRDWKGRRRGKDRKEKGEGIKETERGVKSISLCTLPLVGAWPIRTVPIVSTMSHKKQSLESLVEVMFGK